MIYLDKLINLENNKEMMAKALYMKSFILDKSQKYKESKILKNQLIANFPQSDYSFAVLSSDSTLTTSTKSSNDILVEAEQEWLANPALAIDKYKSIVLNDTISESGLRAAYFLAYNYDYNFVRPDSARKFYEWIIRHHGITDQAKSSKARLSFISGILSKDFDNKN